MRFQMNDVQELLDQLAAEARGETVNDQAIRREAERLISLYPAMAPLLAPIAQRHARSAA